MIGTIQMLRSVFVRYFFVIYNAGTWNKYLKSYLKFSRMNNMCVESLYYIILAYTLFYSITEIFLRAAA